jgi:hypothetical protein
MAGNFNPARAYEQGLVGARFDPRADEEFEDSILRAGGQPDGGVVAHQWEWAGIGKGKLVPTWMHVEKQFPGCWPGPAQQVGDCVSHGCKNAALTTLGCELSEGKPDEVTGKLEGKPDVPEEGVKQGVLSTEAIYWWRYERMGPRSMDGWTCPDAAKHVTTNSGLWIRKPYPDFGFDLTKYSAGNIRKYLGRNPPDNVRDYGRQYLIRTATKVSGFEQVSDFLAAGYGVFFCSGVGWESSRNEDGVSYPRGSWAHSQAIISTDDRPETVKKYNGPLICILNSWSVWNRGPRKVMGTNLMIPHGAYWTPASILSRMSCIALSSVAGWPRRKLATYGAGINL